MESARHKLVVMVDWYEPGFRAGGPIRSAVNLADNLKSHFDLFVITTDRDLGSSEPYKGIPSDQWVNKDGYQIFYASSTLSWKGVYRLLKELNPNVILLNSMFSRYYSIYPVLMKRLKLIKAKLILAPRGMLKDSAVSRKSLKKIVFLRVYRILGLCKSVVFQATDDKEASEVRSWFGKDVSVVSLPNFPGVPGKFIPCPAKVRGELHMVFVGRIHPIKNLDLLIYALATQTAKIRLTVVAPVEDKEYWGLCKRLIGKLPNNIEVKHLEQVPHTEVKSLLTDSHIFALPTAGENFGHAIFEAMAAGRPVLISDQTPWRDLELRKVGWDVEISDARPFEEKIRQIAMFDNSEMNDWCLSAWQFSRDYCSNNATLEDYIKMLS